MLYSDSKIKLVTLITEKLFKSADKSFVNKVTEYQQIIKKVHSKGIAIFGSFILGSDDDRGTDLKDIVDFIMENNIAFSMSNILSLTEKETSGPCTPSLKVVSNKNILFLLFIISSS